MEVPGKSLEATPPGPAPVHLRSVAPPSTPVAAPPSSQSAGFHGSRGPVAGASSTPAPTPPNATPTSQSLPDAYAHLALQQRLAMEEELKQAEVKYGEKMRQAQAVADPRERKVKLEGLRNSFSTKQSMIRKKYGVRLRERRSKAEIQAERNRMGLDSPGDPDLADPRASGSPMPTSQAGSSRPRPSASHVRPPFTQPPASQATSSSLPRPPKHPAGAGWTAANVPATDDGDHPAKRLKFDEGSSERDAAAIAGVFSGAASAGQVDSPVVVTTTVSHAGDESVEPSAQANSSSSTPVASQTSVISHARVQIFEPLGAPKHPSAVLDHEAPGGTAPSAGNPDIEEPRVDKRQGSEGRPISVGGTDTEMEGQTARYDDSSTDDDSDIPARLPPAGVQSLQAARGRL